MDFEFHKVTADDLKELGLTPDQIDSIIAKEALHDTESKSDTKTCDINADRIQDGQELHAPSEFQTLDFKSPAQLLAFFDSSINQHKVILHPWQVEISNELSATQPTALKPMKYVLCAANGSGKDAFVIAPFCAWFILTKVKSRVVITSSSGQQLTAQTETYIKNMCNKVNQWAISAFGGPILKINQRYIHCSLTGSEIRMYATDEPGKAEGYHPIEPDSEFAIVINEAKSIPEEIFTAITRCTGFNYWLEVSTPGEPFGHFYYAYTNWNFKRRVTAFDCPHLGTDYIEDVKRQYGEFSPLYRSMILALFTSVGGNVVIPEERVSKNIAAPPPLAFQHWPKRVGIDVAAGGDENSFTITRGNAKIFHEAWREFDTTLTADRIDKLLRANGIPKDHEYIYIDDGNVGHSIVDMLIRMGWINVKRIINQSIAFNKREFSNRGAENWYRVARLVEENVLILDNTDTKFIEQLVHRYYKTPLNSARITLESKAEAKANGHPSPDRADSYILSLFGLTIDDFLKKEEVTTVNTTRGALDKSKVIYATELQEHYDDNTTYAPFKEEQLPKGKDAHLSLSVLMSEGEELESQFSNN